MPHLLGQFPYKRKQHQARGLASLDLISQQLNNIIGIGWDAPLIRVKGVFKWIGSLSYPTSYGQLALKSV